MKFMHELHMLSVLHAGLHEKVSMKSLYKVFMKWLHWLAALHKSRFP